jgi:uncharacterized protein YkwD
LSRRAAIFGLVVAALTPGCGGGSGGHPSRPAAQPGSQGPATAVSSQITEGRLGQAVVARPGHVEVTAPLRKLTARDALPRGGRKALGAEANCQNADLEPTTANLPQVSGVIFCLMNAMRENNGLPDLAQESRLAKASVDHSQDMVDNRYFAHDSLDGRDVVARLTAVGYIPEQGDWVVGENLAWGSGGLGTPRALVNAWMNSPPHRENLLSADYKEVGMGVVFGTPDAEATDGITVTTDFGTRLDRGNTTIARPAGVTTKTRQRRASHARSRARCKRRHGSARRRCLKAARRTR